jgi:cell wall-associated NlpC family hydrolase
MLLGLSLPGCAPKRVLRQAPVPALPSALTRPGVATAGGRAAPRTHQAPPAAGDREAGSAVASEADADSTTWVWESTVGPAEFPTDGEPPAFDAEGGDRVAALARTQVGKPYGWGAVGPERFDCSGLAAYVYRQLGIALPRVSMEQAGVGIHVDRSELKPGDLVFFSVRSAFDHVGIFLGNNRFVHAPRRQEPVRVDNLDDAWWNRAYRGARRVFGGEP